MLAGSHRNAWPDETGTGGRTNRNTQELMQQVRWGIIGCGNVTELKSGPAFNKVGQSSLVDRKSVV